MLRITVLTRSDKTVLKVEGKLTGPWVGELQRCWGMALDGHPRERIVIDLTNVTFVDTAGKELIRDICNRGTELLATGPLMTSIVNEVRADRLRTQLDSIKEVS